MTHHVLRPSLANVLIGFCCIFFISLSEVSFSKAETQGKDYKTEILVIGSSLIVDENVASAREAAISEALVKGVEEYLTQRLGDQGMINNFPRLIHEIIPRAREQVENFHILAEDQTDKHYKILVRLRVNEKVMEEKLRNIGLIEIKGPPLKILFLVSQIQLLGGKISYWWREPESSAGLTSTELALHRVFQERGFNPINRLVNVPDESYSSEMKILDLSDESAASWGRLFSADVIIHGRCEILKGEVVYIILSALDVKKGTIIFQDSQTEKIEKGSDGIDQVLQSIERAINKVAIRLGPEIIKATGTPDTGINQLKITLTGMRGFKQFRDFRDFLKKDILGVKSVRQTRVSSNSISISVEFSGNSEKFLDTILGQEGFPFPADVSKTEEGEIIIDIKQ